MSVDTEPSAWGGQRQPGEIMGESPQRGRVLIADDEPVVTRSYERVLVAQGFEVTTAHDGLEAKTRIEREDFDVVLSDVHMPGLSGIDLLRTARRAGQNVPVVLITGSREETFADLASEFGALLYLVKPVEPRVLIQVVEHAIRLHRLGEPGTPTPPAPEAFSEQSDRELMDARLTQAIASLRIVYQPIVHWKERTVFGYEALVRSDEPLLALPLALLDAAESLGRVRELGRAIRSQIASTIGQAPEGARIFVNLHPEELSDPELLEDGAPLSMYARRVILEITERASLEGLAGLPKGIATLRNLGFRIAIDDLGSGYSGLTAFARLMPELVKIDMSLVRDVSREPVKRELIRHVASLCGEMGMLAVAEGVETEVERDTLAEIGCELMQGYLFGKPTEAFEAVRF